MAGQQAVNPVKKGFRRDRVLEREIIIQRPVIEFLLKAGELQDAFDLRRVEEMAVYLGIMHGLDAKEIPGDKEGMILCVENSEAEHAPQPGKQLLFPLLKTVD